MLVLPLEDPLRVAEDSATVDALSGGRLELGVGSGPFPGAWEAFGKDLTERQRIFGEAVTRLHEVLDGVPLNSGGESLHPSGAGVRRRLWQATTSNPDFAHASAAAAALAGDGLQLSRANVWAAAPSTMRRPRRRRGSSRTSRPGRTRNGLPAFRCRARCIRIRIGPKQSAW